MFRALTPVALSLMLGCSHSALPPSTATRPVKSASASSSAALNKAQAQNVELSMELHDLIEQNAKLRLDLAGARGIAVYGSNPMQMAEPGHEETSEDESIPPTWQRKQYGGATFYVIPLDAGTSASIPTK